MRKIGQFMQYDWNFYIHDVLIDMDNTYELTGNACRYNVYQYNDNTIVIIGDKAKYYQSLEYLDNNIERLINKNNNLFDIKSGIMAIIPKKLYKNNNIYKIINISKGINSNVDKNYYSDTEHEDLYKTSLGSLAYDPENNYNGFFIHGFVKNFCRPVKLNIIKCNKINGYIINYS